MSEERSEYNHGGPATEYGDYTDAELDAIDRWAAFGRSADCVTIGRLIGQIRRMKGNTRAYTTAQIKGGLTEGAMDGDMFSDPKYDQEIGT